MRIINCARGGLIVEKDLKEAIESGHVAGAALDVFEVEPTTENILFGMDQVICTPHLGASTNEAQENVALQVAEQMSEFLTKGTVMNAINMPSLSAEDASKLKPYLMLAEQLGSFAGQLTEHGIKSVSIEYAGKAATLNTKPLTSAIMTGLLAPLIDSVNMVNAMVIAKERQIDLTETTREKAESYQTMIRVTVVTEKRTRDIAGTIFGEQPRIVELHGTKLEAQLAPMMLYVNNEDKPGFVGNLGNLLGENKINIANFHLGRNDERNDAVVLVQVDNEISKELLEKISKLPSVKQAKLLRF